MKTETNEGKRQELLSRYYTDLIMVERRSKQTAETYKLCVEEFLSWCVKEQIKLKDTTVKNLMYYLVWRKTQDCTELTIAKDISALRSFGSYLVRFGFWTENEALILDRPKAARKLPSVLSIEQVDSLLDAIDTSTILGVRDRALFELIYSCGLRISEASGLLIGNLHLVERLILVRGKGDKERIVPFGKEAQEKLKLYLNDVRPLLVKGKSNPFVFVNY